ncbi:MAG TPA: NfeD family protein [Thermodesulfovibrionia bacterium]|nr:NfeD family protein [Thermodesulfovibrionia bacterium]
MEGWQVWIIFGIVLLILEVITSGFYLAGFGIACFGASVAAYLDGSFNVQLLTFSMSVIALFFGVRPFFVQYVYRRADKRSFGVKALIGQTAIVTESINNAKNIGRVQVGGESWKALADTDQIIEADEMVLVKRFEGVTLFVVKKD